VSGIVLSASVRQNLLSLQSTASLLATTQNDLATGNKVNSALDNPTSYFTAAALNNRASDISNLLDGIGNGVQVLQAANTGITSLQSLVASAQSVANQVLQTPIGYSTKSSVSSTAISGATANNLLGSTAATSGSVAAGAFTTLDVSGSTPATTAANITGNPVQSPVHFGSPGVQFTLDVDGVSQNISLTDSSVTDFTTAGGTLTGSGPTALSAQDVADIIDFQFNGSTTGAGPVSVNGGGDFQFASSASGSGSQVSISSLTGGVTGGLVGLGGTNNVSHIGVDAIPAAQNSRSQSTAALPRTSRSPRQMSRPTTRPRAPHSVLPA
jgi:flagellin